MMTKDEMLAMPTTTSYYFRLTQLAFQVDMYQNRRFDESLSAELHEILVRDVDDILECASPDGPEDEDWPEDEEDTAECLREGSIENWLDSLICELDKNEVLDYDSDGLPFIRWVKS